MGALAPAEIQTAKAASVDRTYSYQPTPFKKFFNGKRFIFAAFRNTFALQVTKASDGTPRKPWLFRYTVRPKIAATGQKFPAVAGREFTSNAPQSLAFGGEIRPFLREKKGEPSFSSEFTVRQVRS